MATPNPDPRARILVLAFVLVLAVELGGACVDAGGVIGRSVDTSIDAGIVDGGDDGGDDAGADAGIVDAGQEIIDEAGDADAPFDVSLPFTIALALDPAGDSDCFRFTLAAERIVRARVASSEATCDDDHDTALALDPTAAGALAVSDDESPRSRCPVLGLAVDAGEHVLCVDYFLTERPLAVRDVTLVITAELPAVCGDGRVGFGESCDDGEILDDDGCDSLCATEPGFVCPPSGGACASIVAVDATDTCSASAPILDAPAEGEILPLLVDLIGVNDDIQPACLSITGGGDGFFRLRATENGKVGLRTQGDEDPVLMVLASCGGAQIACDDSSGVGVNARVDVNVSAGDVLFVVADFFDEFVNADSLRIDVTFEPDVNDVPRGEQCLGDVDEDADGRVDCADADCDGDARCGDHVSIPDVQTVITAGSRVTVVDAYVTVRKTATSGNTTLILQASDGTTDFGGVHLFVSSFIAPTLPAFAGAQIGACVSASGDVLEFNGVTEISAPTFLSVSSACPAETPPLVVTLTDVATDVDPGVLVQPGLRTETLESVLVSVLNVDVVTVGTTTFIVSDATGAALIVSDFLSSDALTVIAGEHLTSVTGVIAEFGDFRLEPRSSIDIVR